MDFGWKLLDFGKYPALLKRTLSEFCPNIWNFVMGFTALESVERGEHYGWSKKEAQFTSSFTSGGVFVVLLDAF